MNPYTQDSHQRDHAWDESRRTLCRRTKKQPTPRIRSNAFGGSRQGIQQGVAQAQGAQNVGLMLANLNNANFTQAQAAATGDINRQLQAAAASQTSPSKPIWRGRTKICWQIEPPTRTISTARSRRSSRTNLRSKREINSDIAASQGPTNTSATR